MGMLETEAGQEVALENRVWPRLECDIDTNCSTFRGRWACKIVDVSERGIGIVTLAKLQKGMVVTFEDPKTRAQVVWSRENRAGLRILN